MANATRWNIKVPLGDDAHPDEEEGSTKYVRRKLVSMKGKDEERTAVVYWRGQHHTVKEIPSSGGSFQVTGIAKGDDVPVKAVKAKAETKPDEPAKPTVRKTGAKAGEKAKDAKAEKAAKAKAAKDAKAEKAKAAKEAKGAKGGKAKGAKAAKGKGGKAKSDAKESDRVAA